MDQSNIRFAMVAGEASGDILGASLIRALKVRYPQATFEGVGGEHMIAEGFHSFFPLERLSVMGFIEPLKRLSELLRIRKRLIEHFIKLKPTAFIGIDLPDFNLSIAKVLKRQHLTTIHYVSPTVWAWRKGRIKNIKKSIDLMLTLFPFETKIYDENQIPVCYVGHPLADQIPLSSDKTAARQSLRLPIEQKIVAILPGSRNQELKYLAKEFIDTAKWLWQYYPSLLFIAACPNVEREQQLKSYVEQYEFPQLKIFTNQTTAVMASADCVLVASGTASLQAMLVKRPTVIAYKMAPLAFAIAKRLVKIPFIGLPNLLANERIMPEFIQDDAIAEKMGPVLLNYLQHPEEGEKIVPTFNQLHHLLRKNAGETAAARIAELIEK
ncbi:MAG: lipid-A-disaccharide synthase [Candidatus Berkiellales bacterium]